MRKAEKENKPVVITDIRTEEELSAIFNINHSRVYWIRGLREEEINEKGFLVDSKLQEAVIANCLSPGLPEYDMRCILNEKRTGLYAFYRKLDHFFFKEDIKDIHDMEKPFIMIGGDYIDQFEVRQKGV